ncbi:MAG TPA: aminoglycoside phosphotransferase family protein [Caulobacteraceae bacterium]
MPQAQPPPDAELAAFVAGLGLSDRGGRHLWTPLAGGVSCEAWRVETPSRTLCVKRARARLAVVDDWRAPVERVRVEYRWFETARSVVADAAPRPLGLDAERGLIAMEFLEAADHPLWKIQLLAGEVDVAAAALVGARIGAIHAATAGRRDIEVRFASDAIFFALRLEPYLLAAAERRPGVAAVLRALSARTERTRLALVHGDVSPKNILVGPKGPIFLDAETAWYGDPAFDLAFCLNHLLLKCLVVPAAIARLAQSFRALAGAYLERVEWEPRSVLEARAASLIPGLLLARVDGKSPVEYLTSFEHKAFVRTVAEPLLLQPPTTLEAVRSAWQAALEAASSRLKPC